MPCRAEGTPQPALAGRREQHSLSLKEPPRFCTRFRPKVLCKKKKKRRTRCSYWISAALGSTWLLQEGGEGTCAARQRVPPCSYSLIFV